MPFEGITRTITTLKATVMVGLILACTCAAGDPSENPYRDYLQHSEIASDLSGGVLVSRNESILFAQGYGLADRDKSTPITAETKFLLCSVTKPFTALGVFQLVEAGKLTLEDPVARFFPEYARTAADRITIYNLLTHTSGLEDYLALVDSTETFREPIDPDSLIATFMKTAAKFEPDVQWEYSNSNYYLLGRIIEKVSGVSYGEYVKEHIFSPSGMSNSGLPVTYLNDLAGSATGYRPSSKGITEAVPEVHSSWPYAAGGLYSTILDLAKWDRALRGESLVSAESKTKIFTPYQWRYGCGWEIDTLFGETVVSHGGTGGGYCSILIRLLDRPLCVAILSNNESSFRRVSKIAHELLGIALGRPPEIRSDKEISEVDPRLLEEYAGDYEVAPGIALTFVHRHGRLFTHAPGQPEVEIFPRSETEFFMKVVEGSVQFVRDSTGSVSSIIVHQGGRNIPAQRER